MTSGCVPLTVAIVIGAAGIARAQSATGAIEGLVVDPSAAVLPGVAISIRQPAAGVERTSVTDERGTFRTPLLPVGDYELTAAIAGFEARRFAIRLTVGQTVSVRIELALAGVGQSVSVSAASPLLEGSRSQVSATIDEVAARNLPVNGRNFLDFVLLTPGVTRDARQGDLSFAGQRGTLNSLVVDGADNNNTFAGQTLGRTGSGRAPYQFSADAVQEFQVSSSSYSAEYGRAGAGIINVVTRSGTNILRGSLFDFYRDKAMNATSVINKINGQPKSPYHYHQFGGTLGGPLRRNRDFFFANYDGQRNRQDNPVALTIPADTPNDPDTRAGIAGLAPLAYSWDRALNQDVLFLKTDHRLSGSQSLTIRYNHQNFIGEGYETGGLQTSFEHTGDSLVRTRTASASWASAAWSRVFNELKVHYARDHQPGESNSENPAAAVNQSAQLVLLIGRNNFSPRANTIDRIQVADTLTVVRGAHQVKGGVDLQLDRITSYFPGFFSGQYIFRSLAAFGRGRPDGPNESYQQNFPGAGTSGPETRPDLTEVSAFVHDVWRPRNSLTVNAGVRYDLSRLDPPPATNPDPQLIAAGIDTGRFEPDVNNVAPRLGVAWSPAGRPFVIRGGSGIYYGRIPAVLVSATANNGVNVISVLLRGPDVPTYPQKLASPPFAGGVRPSIFYIDRAFANPRVTHATASVELALDGHTTLDATYLFAAGSSLSRSIDRNLGTLGERTLTLDSTGETVRYHFFGAADRPFTNFERVVAFESNAESEYHGVTLDLNRRFAGGAMFRAAYTLGRVIDTVPDATAVALGNIADDAKYASNPADFEVDRTAGTNDQRHRLVASGVYGVRRWWLSGIFTAQSGQPYSARINGDLNGDGNTRNDLAPGTKRNSLRLPAVVQLDLRIARDIPLGGRAQAQLIAEAFNVFNRDNITFVVPFQYGLTGGTRLTSNPMYGRPVATAGERIVQLACRVKF